ncbi:MAG: hypothetical protein JWN30_1975 [Bacilli bacterium]|nr:hypothetical protein [Bacilli bacterium]
MECSDIKASMHDFLDDDVEVPVRIAMEEHIRHCIPCRQHFTELVQVVRRLDTMEWVKGPTDFTAQVLDRLPAPAVRIAPAKDWRYPLMRGIGIAASVVMCIGFGLWWAAPHEFLVSASNSQALVISKGEVQVPKGQVYKGDLIIQNGDALIDGTVDGSVTTLGGHIYEEAGADITGDRQEVVQAYQWFNYYFNKMGALLQNLFPASQAK